jgi:hypothetical protein
LIAKLATFRADGTIHLVAIWFLWDDGTVSMPTHGKSRKAKNLLRDPRATVLIDHGGEGFDVYGVMLVGTAALLRGPEAFELNRRVHLRYVSETDLELEPVRRSLRSDDVTIRFRPERTWSWDFRHIERQRRAARSQQREFSGP